jgi:hypothetical protein
MVSAYIGRKEISFGLDRVVVGGGLGEQSRVVIGESTLLSVKDKLWGLLEHKKL